jgi:WD40 repeat protein
MHIFTGSDNGEVCIYDLQTSEVVQKIRPVHDGPVVALDTHPKKQMVVFSSLQGNGNLEVYHAP